MLNQFSRTQLLYGESAMQKLATCRIAVFGIGGGTKSMAGDNKSALIAMSGGVDSSVAAYLMKNQGYRCMGITMRLYRNNDIGLNEYHTCCSQKDIDDAGEVAFHLDIPYEVLDFTLDFHSGHRNTCASEGKDQIQTEGTMGDGLSTGGRPDKTHLR